MGYSTNFYGEFKIDRPVNDETYTLLEGLNKTRRMKRDVAKLGKRVYKKARATKSDIEQWTKEFGDEGEFWVGDLKNIGDIGQAKTLDIIDYNKPPKSQPSLWCQWMIETDKQIIRWDGGEKFYHYTEWIEYIIEKILNPRGYFVNGAVTWQGEDNEDAGQIEIVNNKVNEKWRVSFYLNDDDASRVIRIVNDYLNNPLKEIIDHKLNGGK